MSEHLFRFLLNELETVRIQCCNVNCGVVTEFPWHRLKHVFGLYQCPACQVAFRIAGDKDGPNWLHRLQEALQGIRESEHFKVQFVLSEKGVDGGGK